MGIVRTRIGLFQYLLFGEKLKLHHFCILLKVCNITALWWWYFTDDENFSRLHCQMSKLIDILEIASYLCNACVQDILISMGNIYLKILFSALPQIVFYYTWPPPQRILFITHRRVCPLSIYHSAATLKICHILLIFGTIFGHSLPHFKNKFQSGQ